MSIAISSLIKKLTKLPTIGPKSATKIAYYLIQSDLKEVKDLSKEISEIKDKIKSCSICGSFTENDICDACLDEKRDRKTLCVVEEPQDVLTIENSGIYNGLYHVLGGAIDPLSGITTEHLNFKSLVQRVLDNNISEVIIATNPTEEGDTTSLYVINILKQYNLHITRLASGLPIGGDLEYADKVTVARSIRSRVKIN